MIEEIRKLQERKQKLLESVKSTKEKKQGVIKIVQDLLFQYNSGRLSKQEYDGRLRQSLDKRSSEQWIKYYDDFLAYYNYQIKLCDKLIREGKLKDIKQTIKGKSVLILKILIILVLLGLIVFLFFIFKPNMKEFFEDIGEKMSIDQTVPVLLEPGAEVIEESLIQYQAVLGKPVKWKKEFVIADVYDFKLELPENSENVVVKQIKEGKEQDISSIVEVDKKGIFKKRVEVGIDKKTITGNAVLDVGAGQIGYEIEYETPSPEIFEQDISKGKRIIIRGPDDVHYENILSFAKLPQGFTDAGSIKLYEIKNGQRIATEFSVYDTDEDGAIDFIEWITPYLSEAVFEIIIEISKAEHLDSERNFISDIYEQVKAQDNVWSETINNGEYVRVTFEQMLDSSKDITIYPRVIEGEPKIEVYEVGDDEIIAEFIDLVEGKNTIYLTELVGTQDVFDLRVVDGSVDIDYVVDPIISQCPFGMVSYWTFDNDDYLAPTVYDVFGTNDGTNNDATTGQTGVNSIVGEAFYFDGDVDYIDINSADFDILEKTVSFWIKTDQNIDYSRIIAGPSEYTNKWIIGLFDGRLSFVNAHAGTGWGFDQQINNNIWYFVTLSINSSGNVLWYLNGISKTTTQSSSLYGSSWGIYSGYFRIGARQSNPFWFRGLIDELAIFDRALTPAEIQQLYDDSLVGEGYCGEPPVYGCNPDASICTDACDGIFDDVTGGWYLDSDACYDITLTYAIMPTFDCDMVGVSGADSDCAGYPEDLGGGSVEAYFCPSFSRKGGVVSSGDCICLDEEMLLCGSPSRNYDDIFNFSSEFFAGPEEGITIAIIGETSDGYIYGSEPDEYGDSYMDAWLESYRYRTEGGGMLCGQSLTGAAPNRYEIRRTYLDFDTSSIPDSAEVTEAILSLKVETDSSDIDIDFDVMIYDFNWEEPIDEVNREANYDAVGANYDALWRNTAGISEGSYYNSFDLNISWINKTGDTKYQLRSSRDKNKDEPTRDEGEEVREYVTFRSADSLTPGQEPILYITYIPDTTPPNVTINTPTNKTYSSASIVFNVTVLDNGIMSGCKVTIDGGASNLTLVQDGSTDDYTGTNTTVPDGSYKAQFYCNDIDNNINNSEGVNFSVDTTPPFIAIIYPVNGTIYGADVTELNYIVFDDNLDSCWYSLNKGFTNVSFPTCSNIIGLSSLEGLNTWTVYANDTVGNENFSLTIFIVDRIAPDINFEVPTSDRIIPSGTDILVNVSANDSQTYISTFIDFNNSLVGWWRMDDVSGPGLGETVYDNSTYSNHGIAVGDAVQVNDGYLGKGFKFDGDGDYIDCGDDVSVQLNSFSVSAWINVRSHADDNNIAATGTDAGSDGNGWYFSLLADGKVRVQSHNEDAGPDTYDSLTGNTNLNLNTWYHVVGVFYTDGLTRNKVYVNGLEDDISIERTSGAAISSIYYVGDSLRIGYFGDHSVVSGHFNGTIDDVMIFNRSLSKEEIYGLYANTSLTYLFQDFIGLIDGEYVFKAYVQDMVGNVNMTEQRTVFVGEPYPPEIVNISDILNLNVGSPDGLDRDLMQGDIASKNFTFYVYSQAGPAALPSGVDVNDANVVISLVNVDSVKKGKGIHRKSRIADGGLGCVRGEDAKPPAGSPHDTEFAAVYTCTVNMQHYDDYGSSTNQNWEVSPYIKDNFAQETGYDPDLEVHIWDQSIVRNTYFNPLTAERFNSGEDFSLNFASAFIGTDLNIQPIIISNLPGGDYPLVIENIGNTNISSVEVSAYDIPGLTTSTEYIRRDWFSVAEESIGSGDEVCTLGVDLSVFPNPVDTGAQTIPYGSIATPFPNDGLRFCLREVQGPLSIQEFSTTGAVGTPWEINAVFTFILSIIKFFRFNFEITILLAAVIIKKKNKKSKKKVITEENLLEVFEKKLKEKYNVGLGELLQISEKEKAKKDLKIPISIFNQEVSPAEALTKYLKENLGLKFKEIARLINRDERSIWISYRNAIKKMKKKIRVDGKVFISTSIFSDRRLSILENVVDYLRKQGFRNSEIAEILGKDQRNIYTLYSRVRKKLG